MTTKHLTVLIEQVRRLNGLSLADMVKRATARGERLSTSNIARVSSGDNPNLSRATIYGLAAGLGVTPATVARAALADMGIVFPTVEPDTETAIRTDPTLPEQGQRMLLALLAEIRSASTPQARARDSYNTSNGLDGSTMSIERQYGLDVGTNEDVALAREAAREILGGRDQGTHTNDSRPA